VFVAFVSTAKKKSARLFVICLSSFFHSRSSATWVGDWVNTTTNNICLPLVVVVVVVGLCRPVLSLCCVQIVCPSLRLTWSELTADADWASCDPIGL
jgi:hypothetical protein